MSAFCTHGCFVAYICCLHFIFKYHASDAKIYCVFPSVQLCDAKIYCDFPSVQLSDAKIYCVFPSVVI